MKLLASSISSLIRLLARHYSIAHFARNFLMDDARHQVLQQAQLIAASASATQHYTDQEVSPAPQQRPQHDSTFLPQTIPFYAANLTCRRMRATYPEYVLRETALNPPTSTTARRTGKPTSSVTPATTLTTHHVGDAHAHSPMLYAATPIVTAPGCLPATATPRSRPRPCSLTTGTIMALAGRPMK